MIRQDKAIEWLTMLREKFTKTEYAEYLDMAIKALEAEPCEDCISREVVDDYIAKLMSGYLYDEERTRLEEFSAYLWELPSVKQEPKTGRWIRVDKDKLRCSKCEVIHLIAQYPNGKIDWCPNCGAKMESEVQE